MKHLKNSELKEELLRVEKDVYKISRNDSNWLTEEEKNDIIKNGEALSKVENDIIKSGEGKDGRRWRESVFVTAKEIEEATEMSRKAAEGVRRALDYTSKKGHSEKCEIMVTLSAADGKNLGCEVIGQPRRIAETDKGASEWFHLVKSSPPQSLIIIHNHNNISPLSESDLKTFMYYDSIKFMFAVDMGGNVYYVKKTKDTKRIKDGIDVVNVVAEKFESRKKWTKQVEDELEKRKTSVSYEDATRIFDNLTLKMYNRLNDKLKFEWKEWKR